MINVKNLSKVYKSKKGLPCVALDDLSFTLADKGMVFILGKSGSGKSTLLNLLSGLDTVTSGDIIIDGNNFSSFNERDYENYRNSYVGFIFQDFCLIESLSVKENIELSLKLQGKTCEKELADLLNTLELTSLENRLPVELSGGQRQRVAIARAMIKSPKLILADEPTGNLDSLSAVQVLTSLKKISADNLVVVVSHNPEDAERYGDRIIEIADGKIISDVTRNDRLSGEVIINENEIIIPDKKRLNQDELTAINNHIKNGKVSIKQAPALFSKTQGESENSTTAKSVTFTRSKMTPRSTLKFSFRFLLNKLPSFIFSILMVTVIVVMFGLCQLISLFDENSALNSAIQDSKEDVFIMQKAYEGKSMFNEIKTDGLVEVTDEDVQKFYDAGYEGKVYKLYNSAISPAKVSYKIETQAYIKIEDNYKNFYALEDMGVLVCDEEFLIKKFGKDGKLNYLAQAGEKNEGGIIITDYVADSIIAYSSLPSLDYAHIVGTVLYNRAYVNAIIDTGYKQKYASIMQKFKEYSSNYSPETRLALIDLTHEEEYIAMLEDLNSFLNVSYCTNPNFIIDSNNYSCRQFTRILNSDLYTEDGDFYYIDYLDCMYATVYSEYAHIERGEIIFPLERYNQLFKKDLVSNTDPNFEEKTITLKCYPKYHTGERVMKYEITFNIVGLTHDKHAYMNAEDLEYMRSYELFPYALYFDNTSDVINVNQTGKDNLFVATSGTFEAITSISEIVVAFKGLFLLIAICICIAGLMILISFGFSNVRKRNFEIGVIRALGGTIKEVSLIFITQMVLAGVFICLLSSLGLYFAVEGANSLLGESFMVLMNNASVMHLEIVTFNPIVLVIDLAVIIFITFISAFAPILSIRKVKPLEILRKKD